MNYISTSRSNPQFYIFTQLFEHSADRLPQQLSDSQWKDSTKNAAWEEFWQREGHDLLELNWHNYYPEYKQNIDSTTSEERTEWEDLWQEHAKSQSEDFYHIFSSAFENYVTHLYNGLIGNKYGIYYVEQDLANLELEQESSDCESSQDNINNKRKESKEQKNDLIDEEEELKQLGLPTSFGGQGKFWRRSPRSVSETESEQDMAKDHDEALHSVQKRISKNKKRQKKSKAPDFMQNDNTMMKYWFKRFSLFSRFDHGIQLDRESWFSVTPEKIAKQTARRLASSIVVDAFCGCGGNAIQLAMTCDRVIAIDIDANKLAMAKHNAAIYGVSHKIEFVHADFLHFARSTRLRPNAIFLSPPWGGPKYQKQSSFDIEENLLPLGATQLMQYARKLSDNVSFFLPRNSNIKQLIALSQVGQQCEVEHNYLDTRLVAITAYYGNLVNNQSTNDKDSVT